MKKFLLVLAAFGLFLGNTHAQTMVVAPHPDDEILGAGNLIRNKVLTDEKIYVVFLTDGEALTLEDISANEHYGRTRRNESKIALEEVGVPKKNTIFLGFPDGELTYLNDTPRTSPYLDKAYSHDRSFIPGVTFTKPNLVSILDTLITGLHIKDVYYTSPHDKHEDHAYTGRLMREILPSTGAIGHEYTIHRETPRHRWLGHDPYPKLDYIRHFYSQYHTPDHQYFLETFAYFPEKFERYAPQ